MIGLIAFNSEAQNEIAQWAQWKHFKFACSKTLAVRRLWTKLDDVQNRNVWRSDFGELFQTGTSIEPIYVGALSPILFNLCQTNGCPLSPVDKWPRRSPPFRLVQTVKFSVNFEGLEPKPTLLAHSRNAGHWRSVKGVHWASASITHRPDRVERWN